MVATGEGEELGLGFVVLGAMSSDFSDNILSKIAELNEVERKGITKQDLIELVFQASKLHKHSTKNRKFEELEAYAGMIRRQTVHNSQEIHSQRKRVAELNHQMKSLQIELKKLDEQVEDTEQGLRENESRVSDLEDFLRSQGVELIGVGPVGGGGGEGRSFEGQIVSRMLELFATLEKQYV